MKNKKNIQKILTFNVQGLICTPKQQTVVDDFQRYKMTILYVQVRHWERLGAKA